MRGLSDEHAVPQLRQTDGFELANLPLLHPRATRKEVGRSPGRQSSGAAHDTK
jgi:hypothetical protein